MPGRGYSFVAPVSREQHEAPDAASAGDRPASNLPVSLTHVIGRDEIIAALAAQLRARRFLTILGPGGVGKTTVAVAVAEALAGDYADGVRFAGLGALADPALVPATVLAAFGETPAESDPGGARRGAARQARPGRAR